MGERGNRFRPVPGRPKGQLARGGECGTVAGVLLQKAEHLMTSRRTLAWAALLAPLAAHASFLSGDALDTAANWLAWFIIFLVPVVGIAVFLFIHVLPEKIAEKRHHPHKDSIKVLCRLSLFFCGMLWPFAWLWAYTRPIGSKA